MFEFKDTVIFMLLTTQMFQNYLFKRIFTKTVYEEFHSRTKKYYNNRTVVLELYNLAFSYYYYFNLL